MHRGIVVGGRVSVASPCSGGRAARRVGAGDASLAASVARVAGSRAGAGGLALGNERACPACGLLVRLGKGQKFGALAAPVRPSAVEVTLVTAW